MKNNPRKRQYNLTHSQICVPNEFKSIAYYAYAYADTKTFRRVMKFIDMICKMRKGPPVGCKFRESGIYQHRSFSFLMSEIEKVTQSTYIRDGLLESVFRFVDPLKGVLMFCHVGEHDNVIFMSFGGDDVANSIDRLITLLKDRQKQGIPIKQLGITYSWLKKLNDKQMELLASFGVRFYLSFVEWKRDYLTGKKYTAEFLKDVYEIHFREYSNRNYLLP